MTPTQIDIILKFVMSKLSPDDLEELDGMLDGSGKEPVAQDARLPANLRKDWLNKSARVRNDIRSSFPGRQPVVQDASFDKLFPDASRLR